MDDILKFIFWVCLGGILASIFIAILFNPGEYILILAAVEMLGFLTVAYPVTKIYRLEYRINNWSPKQNVSVEKAKTEIVDYFAVRKKKDVRALNVVLDLQLPLDIFATACKELEEEKKLNYVIEPEHNKDLRKLVDKEGQS